MSQTVALASRVVSDQMQEEFANFSGDWNPMHMDPVAARRTQAGQPVVHGVHTLLWALESLTAKGHLTKPPSTIKASFLKWVYLGEETVLTCSADDSINPTRLQVEVLGMPVLTVNLAYEERRKVDVNEEALPSPDAPLPSALDLSFADLIDRSGNAFTTSIEETNRSFPSLTALLNGTAVAEIAACSYIVGMEAPGLHSMFSKLNLTIGVGTEEKSTRYGLHFLVSYSDERFRKAKISVTGRLIFGMLDVFVRVPPVVQPSMHDVREHIESTDFADMNALIIGGSRGLGELTAKIIAGGGGSAIITYAMGQSEANSLADDIRRFGGKAEVLHYDVRSPADPQVKNIPVTTTHLFYFATNTIFKPKKGVLSIPMLLDFQQFYVQGFYDLCLALANLRSELGPPDEKLIAFYPSTVFIEERPAGMTEYVMMKSAGELLCADMNIYLPDIHVISERLPKLSTDQTAGVLPERDMSALRILIPIIRKMKEASKLGAAAIPSSQR
jgi:hypothetical protein